MQIGVTENITFYNTFANIYPYCTYSPNPKYEMKVCDCDGNVVANDPFMNKDNTEYCYIKHLFCTSFNDLLRKIKNGFPKENPPHLRRRTILRFHPSIF